MSGADNKQRIFEAWNRVAALYQSRFMDLDIYNDSYQLFCDLLPQQARVLELACGPGNITRYLLQQRPDLKITGIDIAPEMIRLAQQNNPNALFETGDIRHIADCAASYNAVLCGFGLPYLSPEETATLLKDCNTLTDGKGILYISFVPGDPAQSGWQTSSSGDQMYFYYHDPVILEQQLLDARWQLYRELEVPYTHIDGSTSVHVIFICIS